MLLNEIIDLNKIESLIETLSVSNMETNGIKFYRKPNSWSDLKSSDITISEFKEKFKNINVLSFKDIYDNEYPKPLDLFSKSNTLDKIFAIKSNKGFFVIDPQGYDYARLIAKLKE